MTQTLDLIVQLVLNLLLYGETRNIPSVRSTLGVPEKARPGEMIVCRRFRLLPTVVGSYRFCSLRNASHGFFRELATMPFAS